MRFNIVGGFFGALALAFTALQPAHATIVSKTISGSVTSAEADNPFKLGIGDRLRGSVTFDTDLLTGQGLETLSFDNHPALHLELHIGTFSFDEDDQRSFSPGPFFIFENGSLIAIDFITEFEIPELNTPDLITFFNFLIPVDLFSPNFRFAGPDVADVSGSFIIPEPGTLALIGVGLAGIGLMRRRRNCPRAA